MYDSVLVAADGTEASAAAVDRGIDLARTHDGTVHALYVVDTANAMGQFDLVVEREEHIGEDAVESVADRAEAAGVPAEKAFRYGRPAAEIVDYALAHDIDLVVVGKRDRSGLGRLLGGPSTAGRVVENAPAPVLVAAESTAPPSPGGSATPAD